MTFLGQNTVAELRDLVAAKDYTIRQISDARSQFNWTDKAAADDWDSDWRLLKTKYGAAKALANIAFAKAKLQIGVSDSLIPAPIEWDAVIRSIRQDDNVQSKGDLQDLSARLEIARGKGIDFSKTPQPKPGSDAELNLFQSLDKLPVPKNPKQLGIAAIVAGTLGAIIGLKIILK